MIDTIAFKIARSLKNASDSDTPSVEVMKFALIVAINTVLTIILSLIIGFVTGKFLDTVIVLCCFALLRSVSGGFHLRSALGCSIASTITIVMIPHIPVNSLAAYILISISVILILIYAPSNIKNVARLPEKYFPLLKIAALFIVLGTVFLSLPLLSLTYCIQSLSLIHIKRKETLQ